MPKKETQSSDALADQSAAYKFDFVLTVVNPFVDYNRGQRITEDGAIQAVIEQGFLSNCTKSPRI